VVGIDQRTEGFGRCTEFGQFGIVHLPAGGFQITTALLDEPAGARLLELWQMRRKQRVLWIRNRERFQRRN